MIKEDEEYKSAYREGYCDAKKAVWDWLSSEDIQPVTPQSKSEDIAKAFQFGLAIGFGERYDELDRVINEIKKVITPLPKGHGDLFDKAEILRFLKCPKYENCDWKNCFDCNESRCINLNNVNELIPIIKADKEESEGEE